jgi:hypothetical protein
MLIAGALGGDFGTNRMNSPREPGRFRAGDFVVLTTAPVELLKGLPLPDQDEIRAIVGKRLKVVGYDEFGYVELEFPDSTKHGRWIWVLPKYLDSPK